MRLAFREAEQEDLPAIIQLLADDPLGQLRECDQTELPDSYYQAFSSIQIDPNNTLLVAHMDAVIVAVLQLTFIPGLTYQGGWRALIEGVRVSTDYRGQGVGKQLFNKAIECARERHCCLLQLTTDKQRPAALAFYESLGFSASHVGMKLKL